LSVNFDFYSIVVPVNFVHSFIPDIYIAPLQETYSAALSKKGLLSGTLSPATAKKKCLKKLAERRHIVPGHVINSKQQDTKSEIDRIKSRKQDKKIVWKIIKC